MYPFIMPIRTYVAENSTFWDWAKTVCNNEMKSKKPTISELERMLAQEDRVNLRPNGSVEIRCHKCGKLKRQNDNN